MGELLQMQHITKSFGEVFANNDIMLDVRQGEVHTLLGENGAGKSTLMSILTGLYQPDYGRILYHGDTVKIDSPKAAVRLGIGMVYQHFMLVENMTVFENIILGSTQEKGIFIQKAKILEELEELADKFGLEVQFDKLVSEISVGEQQRVEILKALYRQADLLILDEPTAALTDTEVIGLFHIIEKLKSENKSVIFISHKMKEVMEISDRITILRAGRTIQTLEKKDTDERELSDLMVGRKLEVSVIEKKENQREDMLRLDRVSYHKESKHNGLNEVSLCVRRGQIVGIAGVDGNGQSQLAQIATGNIRPEEGELYLNQEKVMKFTPSEFIHKGVAHIPEDRNKMGLVGDMSISENLVLKEITTEAFSKGKGLYLKKKEIHSHALEKQKENDIRCVSVEQEARSLSGGNQQKIILGRELGKEPDLLVAVHPTRGLDIGATEYVHRQMVKARDRGCGILLISANLEEVLKLSDVIIVMFEGRIMGTFSGIEPPLDSISAAMTGKEAKP